MKYACRGVMLYSREGIFRIFARDGGGCAGVMRLLCLRERPLCAAARREDFGLEWWFCRMMDEKEM